MSNFNWEKAHYLYKDCDLIADLDRQRLLQHEQHE